MQDGHCMYNVTWGRVRVTIVARGKAINVEYSVCMYVCTLVLVIRHAKRMRRIMLRSVGAVWRYRILLHFVIKDTILGETNTEHKMFALICFTAFA